MGQFRDPWGVFIPASALVVRGTWCSSGSGRVEPLTSASLYLGRSTNRPSTYASKWRCCLHVLLTGSHLRMSHEKKHLFALDHRITYMTSTLTLILICLDSFNTRFKVNITGKLYKCTVYNFILSLKCDCWRNPDTFDSTRRQRSSADASVEHIATLTLATQLRRLITDDTSFVKITSTEWLQT